MATERTIRIITKALPASLVMVALGVGSGGINDLSRTNIPKGESISKALMDCPSQSLVRESQFILTPPKTGYRRQSTSDDNEIREQAKKVVAKNSACQEKRIEQKSLEYWEDMDYKAIIIGSIGFVTASWWALTIIDNKTKPIQRFFKRLKK